MDDSTIKLIQEIEEIKDIQKFIDENILNLKIISKIKENDKLLANKSLLEIDSPHLFQSVNRWYNKENRNITIEKLNNILEGTFKITKILLEKEKDNKEEKSLEDNNSQIFQTLILEMKNSLVGIENLKKTYSEDILVSSQLDLLISKLSSRIEKMSKLFTITL
tara:strand:+ start:525 stop:1016 length:492 start_codon:yes stop_codon:yes gene_type:complete